MNKVNLLEKFSGIKDYWNPRIAGELNGQQVKLAKFLGEFPWHSHELEDEMFLVIDGHFTMEFRDRQVELGPGEFIIVPRGVEHRPIAPTEAAVLLFEPAGTLNTGDRRNEFTRENPDSI
jgi:mannose-6-phosphate isomerase-like protein (cupin superfamily)